MSSDRANGNLSIAVPLVVALVATPWFFGGVWTRTQSILLALCGVLSAIDGLPGLRSDRRDAVVPMAVYPLIGGFLLGLFQLMPLNADGAAKFSPGSVKWRAEASYADVMAEPNTTESPAKSLPRSLYPPSTRENVVLLLLAASVFWLAGRRLTDSRGAAWMLGAVTVCGVVLSLFALVQRFTWNGQIYWTFPLSQGGNAFGPFVNRNNAGGFLNLCLAAGLGAYVWGHDVQTGGGRREAAGGDWDAESNEGRYGGEFGAVRLLVIGALVFMAGAIVASASRGSVLSLVFGLAVVGAGMLTRGGRRSQAIGVVVAAVAALALVIWLGEYEEVRSRFAEMTAEEGESDGRLLNWAEAAQAIPDFWVLGSGLNTYRFVCPPFQERFTGNRWHYYAENQYLQALVDGGAVALGLLLLAIVLVACSIVHLFRLGGPLNTALATMGSFALASQVVGGAFDFGLYLGANAVLMAAICGMVVGRAALQLIPPPKVLQPRTASQADFHWLVGHGVHRSTASAICLMLFILAGFGAVELYRAADVEAIVEPAVQGRIADERDDDVLVAAIGKANDAVRHRDDDANGHHALSELWIQRYRVATYRALRQQQPWLNEDDSWQAASLLNLNSTLRELDADKRTEMVNQMRGDAGTQSLLRPAWQHALRARTACPWVPQTYLTLASLAPFVGDDPDTLEHLEKARRYAGGDPALWYRIGFLEMTAGRTDRAILSWQRSMKLSEQYEGLILVELLEKVSIEEILKVLPDEPRSRLNLVRRLKANLPDEAQRIAEATLETLDSVRAATESDTELGRAEVFAVRAGLLSALQRPRESIADWREALARAPERTDWRTELVEMLLVAGLASEAHDEVLQCLQREPKSARLQALLKRCKADMGGGAR